MLLSASLSSGAVEPFPFSCYPARPAFRNTAATEVHGADARTRLHVDDLLWSIQNDRMEAAGHFSLAEIGCGAGCIQLASVEDRTGSVRWFPETISGWPIHMLQPIIYKPDSQVIVIYGQLNESGPSGPFYYRVDENGFHPLPEDRLRRCVPAHAD